MAKRAQAKRTLRRVLSGLDGGLTMIVWRASTKFVSEIRPRETLETFWFFIAAPDRQAARSLLPPMPKDEFGPSRTTLRKIGEIEADEPHELSPEEIGMLGWRFCEWCDTYRRAKEVCRECAEVD